MGKRELRTTKVGQRGRNLITLSVGSKSGGGSRALTIRSRDRSRRKEKKRKRQCHAQEMSFKREPAERVKPLIHTRLTTMRGQSGNRCGDETRIPRVGNRHDENPLSKREKKNWEEGRGKR